MPATKKPKITAVTIARDALKHVAGKQVRLTQGVYLEPRTMAAVYIFHSLDLEDQVQPVFRNPKFKCDACAIGGLFYSLVHRANDAIKDGAQSRQYMVAKLNPYFSARELALVESAFEISGIAVNGQRCGGDESNAAQKFGRRYQNQKTRFKAICANIIANNGHFMPEEALVRKTRKPK